MKKRPFTRFLLALSILCCMLGRAVVDAETTSYSGATVLNAAGSGAQSVSSYINITISGTYYLTRDLVLTSTATGQCAIAISASNVTIDLNGHTISSYAAGGSVNPAPYTYGIGANNGCSNVTIMNGTIAGFLFGIYTPDSTASGHHIENVHLTNNTCVGAYIAGNGCLVRKCLVNNTGGSTNASASTSDGIIVYGANNRVIECDVVNVTPSANNGGSAIGIAFYNGGDGIALENRISQTGIGIYFSQSSTVKYRENLFGASLTTQVSGTGINAGNNF